MTAPADHTYAVIGTGPSGLAAAGTLLARRRSWGDRFDLRAEFTALGGES